MTFKRKKIIVSVISDLVTDQRVIRIATSLQKMGFDVHVIARSFEDSLPLQKYDFSCERILCQKKSGVAQYAEFNRKLFKRLKKIEKDILLANDLDVLLPNYLIAKKQGKELIYDSHEYFTGVPNLAEKPFKKRIWKTLENYIFPKLKTVYTVNESIQKKYEDEFSNKISVIKNLPIKRAYSKKNRPEKWENKIILLMQGAGINKGRGGMELLESMKYLPDNYHLVFIGGGTDWENIKSKIVKWKLDHKVEMIDKMTPDLLYEYTCMADVGFSLDHGDSINYHLSLANKIFDYIQARVPYIAVDIPEIRKITNQYHCGILIENTEPKLIAKNVLEIISNKEKYEMLKTNCSIAAEELNWENEEQKLISIFNKFL